jgi:hypothetical protein
MIRQVTKIGEKQAATAKVPAGAPHWVTPELIAKTKRVWQRYYPEPLTDEAALGIVLDWSVAIDALRRIL